MIHLFFDIETIPTQDLALRDEIYSRSEFAPLTEIGPVVAATNLKDPEKIAAYIAARTARAHADLQAENAKRLAARDRAYRDTALDGWSGSVAAISWAADELPVDGTDAFGFERDMTQSLEKFDEKACIERFFAAVEECGHKEVVTVGHNIRRFDIVFLWARCIVLSIPVPQWLLKARFVSRCSNDDIVCDTMELAGNSKGTPFGPSLDRMCRALGIPGKGDLDGSGVWDAILEGRFSDVMEYCDDDVRCVRSVWRRLKGATPLAIDMPAAEVAA